MIDLFSEPMDIAMIREVALAMPSYVSIEVEGDARDSFMIVLAKETVPDACHGFGDKSWSTEVYGETFWERFKQMVEVLGDSWPHSQGAYGLAKSLRELEPWLQ